MTVVGAKAQPKGEDTYGNQYASLDEMWKKELDPSLSNEELKIEGRVGDQDAWYKRQVEYWNVIFYLKLSEPRSIHQRSAWRLREGPPSRH